MKILDLTFPTPQENLACEEALLNLCEEDGESEILRFWEPTGPFVVLGYSNKIQSEANVQFCQANKIPVLRRLSGGGTVLQGPGCLNYSLILKIKDHDFAASITQTNNFIMKRHQEALQPIIQNEIKIQGFTDLTLGALKFSGNSQRRKRNYLLFHGTFLLALDLNLVEKTLNFPTHAPTYRQNRSHKEFLTNLGVSPALIKDRIVGSWQANGPLKNIPFKEIQSLAEEPYSNPHWIMKF